ncbi:hypothetical protein GOAMI_16_01030 [Gordonia amicalis NBRC 100051 = JCM 11271]|nr:hypothetical protein GOAMI_16_01030 [Gordonia amicalis NBRC 100051 = JCM 11271]
MRGIIAIEKRSPATVSEGDRADYETELLTQALSGATPAEIQKHAQTIGNTIADEKGGIPACDDRASDTLSHHLTDDSRVEIHANVTQAVGEKFIAMIDERSTPRPEPDGSEDRRSPGQRRSDALETLLDHPEPRHCSPFPPTAAIPRSCPGPGRQPRRPRNDCRATEL